MSNLKEFNKECKHESCTPWVVIKDTQKEKITNRVCRHCWKIFTKKEVKNRK